MKKIIWATLTAGLLLIAAACGEAKEKDITADVINRVADSDVTAQTAKAADTAGITPEITPEAGMASGAEQPDAGADASGKEAEEDAPIGIPLVELPEGIAGVAAETAPNKELQRLIIEYYEIPEEFLDTTRYYYNYVDLNCDGEDEIFTVIMGPYTSGSGGSSALWVVESAGELHVNEDFTLVNTPVILSDKVTSGCRELVIPYYGGGAESAYSVLSCKDGYYSRVNEGTMVETLEGISGTAIIANDIGKAIENGDMGLNLRGE